MAVKRVVYCCNGDYIALIVVIAVAAAMSRGGLRMPGIEPDYAIGLVCLFDTLNGAVT